MSPPRCCRVVGLLSIVASLLAGGGCHNAGPSYGGGAARFSGHRDVNPADVWLPPGYKIEAVAQGLDFPTGVTFDDQGRACVTEAGYSYGKVWGTPRLLRVVESGVVEVIARGTNGPWNGVTFHDGNFYVAEGGEERGGRILKIAPDGTTTALLDGLPSMGDHHTNGPVVGPDGWIYFGQGTATNSGIVGADNYRFGWLERNPHFHDVPGQDVTLRGVNYTTADAFAPPPKLAWYQQLLPFLRPRPRTVQTGAYSEYGTRTRPGQVIPGQVPCTGAVMKVSLDGGKPELVAWGLRNPYGLAFSPDDKLFVTENQFDVRGSRPVYGTGDLLWEIKPGAWYGWPDYFAGEPLNDANRFGPPHQAAPRPLLASHPTPQKHPIAKFGVHSSADGFDFCRQRGFGNVGDAYVAEFGDLAPGTGKVMAPVGFRVARVEMEGGIVHPFAVNRGPHDAPASQLGTAGLERPIAARFDASGNALYVVDFGVMLTDRKGVHPIENTGVLWKITREGTP